MASALPPLYAHRLGRHYGPDSSAAALRHTLTGPVEGLETDVCLTADDRLVLLHDPLLTLGTTLDGWARQRTADEIRSALIRDSAGEPTAEHPLLLEELIDLVPEDGRPPARGQGARRPGSCPPHRRGALRAASEGADPRSSRGDQLSWRGVRCRLRKRDPVPPRDLGRLRARSACFLGSSERSGRDLGRALPALRAVGRSASGRRTERQRRHCEPPGAPKPGARVRSRCDRHRSPSRASRGGRNSHRAGAAALSASACGLRNPRFSRREDPPPSVPDGTTKCGLDNRVTAATREASARGKDPRATA